MWILNNLSEMRCFPYLLRTPNNCWISICCIYSRWRNNKDWSLKLPTQRILIRVDNPINTLDNSAKSRQLLFATQTCIRTRQGQHYRRDVACLEQEFNFTPARGRFKSIGNSFVAVLDNIAYTNVLKCTKVKYINIKNLSFISIMYTLNLDLLSAAAIYCFVS